MLAGDRHDRADLALLTSHHPATLAVTARSSLPYGDTTFALTVDGSDQDLNRRRFMVFATSLGLAERAATRVIDETLVTTERTLATWEAGVEEPVCAETRCWHARASVAACLAKPDRPQSAPVPSRQ